MEGTGEVTYGPTPALEAAICILTSADLAFSAPLKAPSSAPSRNTKAIPWLSCTFPCSLQDTSIFLLPLRIPLATDKHYKLQLPQQTLTLTYQDANLR